MPDDQADESQADDAAEPQAGDQPRSQADRRDADDDAGGDTISVEKARELRRESAQLRKRVKDAESRAQAAEDKDKSELQRTVERAEKAERDAEEHRRELTAVRTERRIRDAAEAAGGRNLRAIYRLVKDDAETDDDGGIANLDALIAQAKKDTPEFFRPSVGKADGGANGPTAPGDTMNDRIRQAAGRGRT